MSGALTFERSPVPLGMVGYLARSGQWQFLIVNDMGNWTVSYRLRAPTTTVSASSTIRGPFGSFEDAVEAAENMRRELRALS